MKYTHLHQKNVSTKKIIYNHIDEIWGIDSADMIDSKNSIKKGFRYIFFFLTICQNS